MLKPLRVEQMRSEPTQASDRAGDGCKPSVPRLRPKKKTDRTAGTRD